MSHLTCMQIFLFLPYELRRQFKVDFETAQLYFVTKSYWVNMTSEGQSAGFLYNHKSDSDIVKNSLAQQSSDITMMQTLINLTF